MLTKEEKTMANRISSLERLDHLPASESSVEAERQKVFMIVDNNEDFDCEIPSEKTETDIKTTSHAIPSNKLASF